MTDVDPTPLPTQADGSTENAAAGTINPPAAAVVGSEPASSAMQPTPPSNPAPKVVENANAQQPVASTDSPPLLYDVNTIPDTVDPVTAAAITAPPAGVATAPVVAAVTPAAAQPVETPLSGLGALEGELKSAIVDPALAGLKEAAGAIRSQIDALITTGISDVPSLTQEGVTGAESIIETLVPPSYVGIVQSIIGMNTTTVNALEVNVDTKAVQILTLIKTRLDALAL
jgi:hypothetical protein